MPQNKASVLTGSQDFNNLTKIEEIPYPTLKDDKVLIKSEAFALNPTDWKHALGGVQAGEPNSVAGSDVSGIVHAVGKNVKGFEPGDIVSAAFHGNIKADNGAFSEYVVVDPIMLIKYPQSQIKNQPLAYGEHPSSTITSFEAAAAVTLGIGTVAQSFAYNFKLKAGNPQNTDKYILIWGGATATGILGIQIAKFGYGLKVITTASSKHEKLLKSIGADHVVDYHDKDVIQKIQALGENKIAYALDTVSVKETFQSSYDATEGSDHVILDNLLFLGENDLKTKGGRHVTFTKTLFYLNDGDAHGGLPASADLVKVVQEFWQNVLPPFIPTLKTPNLKVLKKGFGSVNDGLKLLKEEKVSGEKLVFHLDNFV